MQVGSLFMSECFQAGVYVRVGGWVGVGVCCGCVGVCARTPSNFNLIVQDSDRRVCMLCVFVWPCARALCVCVCVCVRARARRCVYLRACVPAV